MSAPQTYRLRSRDARIDAASIATSPREMQPLRKTRRTTADAPIQAGGLEHIATNASDFGHWREPYTQ